MCGIYGEYFNNGKLSSKESFIARNNLNISRGPDMEGYWSDSKKCQLGFRRLSILDLSASGNQPMCSYDGKNVIVFNGEIYNFQKLKLELIKKQIPFNTHTDTEVLINYITVFGLDKTLELIDGMFAFAVYNMESQELNLVRDFAGIKPLFYSYKNGNVVFGSRYDLVSKHELNKNNGINNEVLRLYLKRHYIPAPYAILKDTFQLEPGEVVTISSNQKLSKKKYWKYPELNREKLIKDSKRALSLVKSSLSSAVKAEMISDVPLGSFLSGGIDSPIITYLAKQEQPKINSFTIGSDSKVHDESEIAKQYAHAINVNMELTTMTAKSALEILDESFEHLKEPFADFSMIPTYLVCKKAKEKCTVMLSGDGGDELFFGYERFASIYKNKKWIFIPKPLRYIIYVIDKLIFKNKNVNEGFLKKGLAKAHYKLGSRIKDELLNELFPNLKSTKNIEFTFYNYDDKLSNDDFLNSMRKAEFYDMMQKTLVKVDRMSMAHSVEVRVPFLKKAFIESINTIAPSVAFQNNNPKFLLKKVLGYLIPGAPFSTKKKGFTIPLAKWLREDLKKPFYDTLFDSNFIEYFGLSKKTLENLWEEHQSGEKNHKWILFTLYSLAKWKRSQDE